MKKGMLALAVLSCVLLGGAPACRHKKDRSKSPPRHTQKHDKAEKKQKKPNTKMKKTAQPKHAESHKK